MIFAFCARVKATDGCILCQEHLASIISEKGRRTEFLKEDGSCLCLDDLEFCYEDSKKSDDSKIYYTVERSMYCKTYVEARLIESATIQGFFNSTVKFPIIGNTKDIGRENASTFDNVQYFMCGVLRVHGFAKMINDEVITIKGGKEGLFKKETSSTVAKDGCMAPAPAKTSSIAKAAAKDGCMATSKKASKDTKEKKIHEFFHKKN